jgi:hypothetical protein
MGYHNHYREAEKMMYRRFKLFVRSVMCLLFVVVYGGVVSAQTFSLDALTAGANGVAPDDLLLPGAALLLPGAAALPPPPPPGFILPPVDVDAFSFSQVFPGAHSVLGVEFSVTPGSIGAAGSAVIVESGGVGGLDEPADIFGSGLGGTNVQIADGDGLPAGPAIPFGVVEPGTNVDGWDGTPPFGPVAALPGIYYTVTAFEAATHPTYTGTGSTGADIFFSPPVVGYSVLPALYMSGIALGLGPLDDIDGLAIIEDGLAGPTFGDAIYFSLTAISPSLAGLGASPADVLVSTLGGAPSIAFTAASLGLLASDDIDALDLFVVPEPATVVLIGLAVPLLYRRRR